jgi:site-specific recombinase XerD
MTPRLLQAMRNHFADHRFARPGGNPTPWIFRHATTRRHAKAGERIRSMRGAFASAAKRANLPEGLVMHDLRHRRVTTWLAAGANAVHVKEAVGHSDLRTTMGYTHLAREHLRSLVGVGEREEAKRQLAGG